MFQKLSWIALALVFSNLGFAADGLDIMALNGVLKKLTAEVLAEAQKAPDSPFTLLKVAIDPQGTNLSEKDSVSVKVDLAAGLNRSLWDKKGPSVLDVSLGGSANRVTHELAVDVGITLQTNVLALSRLVGKEYGDSVCSPKSDRFDPEGKFAKRSCDVAKAIMVAANLREVVSASAKLAVVGQEYSKGKEGVLLSDLAKESDPKLKARLEAAVESARQEGRILDRVRSALDESLRSSEDSFEIVVKGLDFSEQGRVHTVDFVLSLSGQSISTKVKYSGKNIKEVEKWLLGRAEVEKALLKIQNEDPDSIIAVKQVAGFYLSLAGSAIAGEK